MKTLTVVIVSYNVRYYLEQCLGALQRALRNVDAEVVVVDNHSRDGSIDYLRSRFPEVSFIASHHNLGFARANNLAIRQSQSKYVLLLNPDTIVAEDTIDHVIRFMETHEKSGGVGVRMLTATGESAMESRRGLPTPMTAFYKMSGLCSRFPKSRRFGRYYMSYLPWNTASKIEIISGAFCMLRRKAIDEIGLLDETFFMYGEDIDLSYRLIRGGYENWYVPETILHYKGESTKKSSFRYVHVFYEAMLIFFRKYYGHLSVLLSIPIKTAIYAKACVALIKMLGHRMRKSLGFYLSRHNSQPVYIVIGSKESLAQCKTIAFREGMDAQFIEGNGRTNPNGHQTESLPKQSAVCVVYDTEAYAYTDIFRIFSQSPSQNVCLGTYNPRTKVIITPTDTFQ